MMSQHIAFAGGLSIKKAESYYSLVGPPVKRPALTPKLSTPLEPAASTVTVIAAELSIYQIDRG